MRDQTIGERDRRYQDYLRGLRRMGGRPRLVVNNTCPKRDHSQGIRGARLIYSKDDGGFDGAA